MPRPLDIEKETIEILNDCYDPIKIGSLTYLAGDVLAKIDPVALREAANDYADSMVSDGIWAYNEDDGEFYLAEDTLEEASG